MCCWNMDTLLCRKVSFVTGHHCQSSRNMSMYGTDMAACEYDVSLNNMCINDE